MEQNKKSKSTIILNLIISKIQIVVGGFLTFSFFITLIAVLFSGAIKESPLGVFLVLIFTALSALLMYSGIKRGKLVKLFKKYTPILSSDPVHSIEQLAAQTGESVDAVIKNISTMINKGFFKNAYIDFGTKCVVLQQDEQIRAVNVNIQYSNMSDENNSEYITVICNGCGAVNKIAASTDAECEFCGSPLK